MAERIKFAAVINTFDPDAAMHAGRLMHFIRLCGLDPADGTLILCGRMGSEPIPVPGFSSTVHLKGQLCMPQTVAAYLREHFGDEELFLMAGNKFGDELAVHTGTLLGGSSLTGVSSVQLTPKSLIATRKIYAGHVTGRFAMNKKPYVISLEQGLIPDALCEAENGADDSIVTDEILPDEKDLCRNLSISPLENTFDLDDAECVVIAGRGLGNRKNAEEFLTLAAEVSMPVAGSRPCVMNAWLPMNRLIGVSGRMISPKAAILLGVSGAPAFYEGVRGSGRIIAVNRDPAAPVSKSADLFVCGDCMDIFREFCTILNEKDTDSTAED